MIAGQLFDHVQDKGSLAEYLPMGRLNVEIRKKIVAQIENVLPEQNNYYIDTTWFDFNTVIDHDGADNLILLGLVDPSFDWVRSSTAWYDDIKDVSWPSIKSLADFQHLDADIKKEILDVQNIDISAYHNELCSFQSRCKNVIELGYTDHSHGIPIDFYSIFCAENYQFVHDHDMMLDFDPKHYFLCYQFKPHQHRQYLRYLLNSSSCRQKGVMTLGAFSHQKYQYPGLTPVLDSCISHLGPFDKTPEGYIGTWDFYTLGDIDVWKKSFLTVVSETVDYKRSNFISEKIYKPILGLRPFVINGHPNIYPFLESQGFDTFEDLWSHIDLRSWSGMEDHCEKIIKILEYVCGMTPTEITNWYQILLPRLHRNRDIFFEHARKQRHKIENDLGRKVVEFVKQTQTRPH